MRRSRIRQWIALVGLVGYGVLVVVITMWPTPVDRNLDSAIAKVLARLHAHGLPGWFDYGEVEFLANVGLFLPLGFLIALLLPLRAWWLAILIGPAFSGCIELVQRLVLPERYATVGDLVANSIGSLVGSILAFALRAVVDYRDRRLISYELWKRGVEE